MRVDAMVLAIFVVACGGSGGTSGASGAGGAGASGPAASSASQAGSTGASAVSSSSTGGTMSHPICMQYATVYCDCFAELLMKPKDVCVSDLNNACEVGFMQCAATGQTPTQEIQCQIDTMNSTQCDPDALANACNNIPSCS
jgi:hypothetical protein